MKSNYLHFEPDAFGRRGYYELFGRKRPIDRKHTPESKSKTIKRRRQRKDKGLALNVWRTA